MRTASLRPRAFQPIDQDAPFQGMDVVTPSTMLPPSFSPRLENIRSIKGVLVKRPGWVQKGSTLSGIPLALIHFRNAANTEFNVCITTTNMYRWNVAGNAWVDLTRTKCRVTVDYHTTGSVVGTFVNGETMTQAVTGALGKFIFNDTSSKQVFIEWTSGTFNAVNTITGGTSAAVLTPNVGGSAEFTLGNADPWTGGESDIIDWTIATGVDGLGNAVTWLIVTNGKDAPRWWDGVNSKFKNLEDAYGFRYTGFSTCKSIEMFYSHLMLIAPTLSGSLAPYSVAWSDTNSFVNFGEAPSGVGASGIATLTDVRSSLLLAEPLGDRLMLYSTDAITQVTHVGLPNVFAFDTLVKDISLANARTVLNVGPFHVFMSTKNIVAYDGSRSVRDIGDRVRDLIKDRLINSGGERYKAFGFHDKSERRLYFSLPDVSSGAKILVCEFDNFDIEKLTWSQELASSGVRKTSLGLYEDDSDGFGLILGQNDGKIMISYFFYPTYTNVQTDAGVSIVGIYETPDLVAPPAYLRGPVEYQSVLVYYNQIEIEAIGPSGPTLQLLYSLDEGASFTSISSVTLTGLWAKYVFYPNITARKVRFRLQNTSDGEFQIRWIRTWRRSAGVI